MSRSKFPIVAAAAFVSFLSLAMLTRAADAANDPLAACELRLVEVGNALAAYEKDRGRLPDHLSDLVPKYLEDKAALHCPADPTEGSPGRRFLSGDPKLPASYVYDFSADESHGLPQPLGPFPKPDTGHGGWGSCRLVGERQRYFFGDQVPVVRCFHHQAPDSGEASIVNLTRTGRTYRSRVTWEDEPASYAEVLDHTARDLAAGVAVFRANWDLGRLEQYGYGKLDRDDAVEYRPLGPRFVKLGGLLASLATQFPEEERRTVRRIAARYLNAGEDYRRALDEIRESMRLAIARGQYGPETWRSYVEHDSLVMAEAYRGLKQPAEETMLLLLMHAARPEAGYFKTKLGEVVREAGNATAGDRWQDAADPGRLLVGKEAPPFSLRSPSGVALELGGLRQGKKALLVNFWFVGCGACRVEMPHLQKLYQDLAPKGLEVVAVDLGDAAEKVAEFAVERKLTFPVALGTDAGGKEDAVFSRYAVRLYPTSFLVSAADGKVVWRAVGFDEAELGELRRELEKLGVK